MTAPLRDGVYEQLVTQLLERQLGAIGPSVPEIAPIPEADLSTWLTRHLAVEIQRALRTARKPEAQLALAHHILDQLAPEPRGEARELLEGARIAGTARLLRSIYRAAIPERPRRRSRRRRC